LQKKAAASKDLPVSSEAVVEEKKFPSPGKGKSSTEAKTNVTVSTKPLSNNSETSLEWINIVDNGNSTNNTNHNISSNLAKVLAGKQELLKKLKKKKKETEDLSTQVSMFKNVFVRNLQIFVIS
jgi:hypothetical protein